MNAERRADKNEKWIHFGATWWILCAILVPISTGRSFSMYRFNNCTAKIGECKTMKNVDKTKVQSTWRFYMF